MKKLLLLTGIIVLCIMSIVSHAQTNVGFIYDNAGNRIQRQIVLSSKRTVITDDNVLNQLTDDELNAQKIVIYPNPVKSSLTINVSVKRNGFFCTYKLMDNSGKILRTGEINQSGEYSIQMEGYTPSLYFLVLQYDTEYLSYKIIKQ